MKEKLPKVITQRKKRLGRGIGSGKGGHTVGRGQKGQKTRAHLGILFEGKKVKKSLFKRLPFLRGKGKFKSLRKKPIIINLTYLNVFPAGAKVTLETLASFGIVKLEDAKKIGVKILGNGDIAKKLEILVPISHSAAKKIEKAGGKII
ncbi:MAG: 50S ribosomal protein L15 [Patescibacteria group bacterium]